MFFTWFRRLLSSGEGLGDSIGAGYRQWDNRLYALEEESDDWEIWEIGSGREDRDGWPMLITADETGPGWLPFAVRSAISSSSLLSINLSHRNGDTPSLSPCGCSKVRRGTTERYTISGLVMPNAEE
jgi:hypothetical protein